MFLKGLWHKILQKPRVFSKTQEQSRQTAVIPLTDKEKKQTAAAAIVHSGLNSVNSVSAVVVPGVHEKCVCVGGGRHTESRPFNNVFAGCVRGKALRVIHSDSPETCVQRSSQIKTSGARYIYPLKMAKPPMSCFPLLFGNAVTDNL